MIRHLIFDMGNVLLSFDSHQAVRDVLGDHPQLMQIINATTLSPEWKSLDQGLLDENTAIQAMAAHAPHLEIEIRQFMEHWDEFLRPVPGMLPLVEALRNAGYSLHLLSNAGVRFDRYHTRFPVFSLMDTIHISARMKLIKPDPRIYRNMLKECALPAEQCLFIDDMAENIDGAQSVGIHGHQFISSEALRRYLLEQRLIAVT